MYARRGPYIYRTFVGGTVSLMPLQFRFSNRVLRTNVYSVLLVGMSPWRAVCSEFQASLQHGLLRSDYQASVLLVTGPRIGIPEALLTVPAGNVPRSCAVPPLNKAAW